MLCGSSGMLFHSLESFDLPSSWGSRLTSQEMAFGMQGPPTLALMLITVACHIKAQNLSRVKEAISLAYEVCGLHLSAFGHTLPGVWFPLKLRQRFSLACLVYRSQCVIATQRRVNL